jgi:hypothetical protein
MIVSIHQPSYFPWLGLLDKINKSDQFILLDTVQLNDNAFQSRNIFLNHRGEVEYLTIPIVKKDYQSKSIRELKIVDKRWQKKHHGFIIANYKKHPFFDEVYPIIKSLYSKEYTFLVDILKDSMEMSYTLFNIKTETILASDLEIDNSLMKDDLVLEQLKQVSASTYLSGTGAKAYQDEEKFKKEKILLNYQSFSHPQYVQKNANKFELGLSALDMVFNLGQKESKKLLEGRV